MLHICTRAGTCRRLPGRRDLARAALLAAAIAVLATVPRAARAGAPFSRVVIIDAGSTQPISTGFLCPDGTGSIVVLAEGALRVGVLPNRFEEGWFGPAGQVYFETTNQPAGSGMPFGALMGGFNSNISAYQFLGRVGAFDLQPGDAGKEMRLALNLPAQALAQLEGQLTVTVIYIPEGWESAARVEITSATPLPISTGLVAVAGDQFLAIPRGALRDPALPNSAYSDGYIPPEGLLGLETALQPIAGAPYGAVFGDFGSLGSEFFIGDGGAWAAQPSDLGHDLELLLNTDAASQAAMTGAFVVHVFRIPAPDPLDAGPGPDVGGGADASFAAPNPMRELTAIRFRLDQDGPVRLRVYDAQGRIVRSLADRSFPAGTQAVTWDGRDDAGERLPAGTYFYQIAARDGSRTGRIVRIE